VDPVQSTSKTIEPIASSSSALDLINNVPVAPKTVSDIVYQKDGLQLLVERGMFQRQKKFSLQV
jgi:hypothetical protein